MYSLRLVIATQFSLTVTERDYSALSAQGNVTAITRCCGTLPEPPHTRRKLLLKRMNSALHLISCQAKNAPAMVEN
jgi:hypothetical protein